MSAGKIAIGCIVLAMLIFAVNLGLAHFQEWRKRRDSRISAEEMARFNIGVAFRGTRKFDDPRWPT